MTGFNKLNPYNFMKLLDTKFHCSLFLEILNEPLGSKFKLTLLLIYLQRKIFLKQSLKYFPFKLKL